MAPEVEIGWLPTRKSTGSGSVNQVDPIKEIGWLRSVEILNAVIASIAKLLAQPGIAVDIIQAAKIQYEGEGHKQELKRAKVRVGELESQMEVLAERLANLPQALAPTPIYQQMEKLQSLRAEADERLTQLR